MTATKFAIVVAVVVGCCLLACDLCTTMVWDGRFMLQVTLTAKDDRKIVAVAAEALMDKEWAKELRIDPRRVDLNLQPVDWVDGRPFEVRVPCSGRESGLGRKLRYYQFQLLVLQVDFADGAREYLTAEIPDGRVQRQLSVELP